MCSQKCMAVWVIFQAVNISVGSVSIPGCPQARDEGKACVLILSGDLCWKRLGGEEGACPGWGFVPPVAKARLMILSVRRCKGHLAGREHQLPSAFPAGTCMSWEQPAKPWCVVPAHSGPIPGGCSAPLTCPSAGSSLGLEGGNPCRDSPEGLRVYSILALCLNS